MILIDNLSEAVLEKTVNDCENDYPDFYRKYFVSTKVHGCRVFAPAEKASFAFILDRVNAQSQEPQSMFQNAM